MKDEPTTGFSFLLSDSPPPAEAERSDRKPSPEGLDSFDVPTRTPAPAEAASAEPSASESPLTVKRIAFPRPAPTFFSSSVSQVPPTRLVVDEVVDEAGRDLDFESGSGEGEAAPQRRSSATRALRGAAEAMNGTTEVLRKAAGGLRRAVGHAARLRDPVIGWATTRQRPSWLILGRGARSALSASAALVAALACYVAVSQLVSDPPGAESAAESEIDGALDPKRGPATPSSSPELDGQAKPPALPGESSQGSRKAASDPTGSTVTEQLDLPDGLSWPGKGLIEVVTGGRELIYVDGVFTGRGPLRRIPIDPGKHEVVLRTESTEQSHAVDVTVDRRTRLVVGGAAPERAL